jgi:ATP/maltotriose-dependent transcriptional regulator MalT
MSTPEDLPSAVAALKAGRWAEAADAFARLTAASDDPGAQEGLAQAAWWLDDATVALGAREAAYRGFRTSGDDRGAARAAASLGYDSMLFGRGVAVGRGWLTRAADVLGSDSDVPEAGWLAVREAEVALNVDHDATKALAAAARAQQVGRDLGDADLVIVGQGLAGLATVRLGQVDAGMKLLDAAAAAATSGDVGDLMWVGKICCWLISACQDTHDLERAGEWCARVEDISVRRELVPLFAVCRTQYASILLARGDHDGAESALVDVLDRLSESRRLSRLDAVAQLGELRRRQGRLAEAEELLRQAGYLAPALTSLAQLTLDAGDAARAWSIITELLRSTPAELGLERVDALAVAVAAGAAAGHPQEAREAAGQLREIADRVPTAAFRAQAAAAEARLSDGATAVAQWQDAVRHFHAAGLSFNEAESRLELADALLAADDRGGAAEQAGLALEQLLPLQAGHGIERARRLLDPPDAGPLSERQCEVLRLLAQGLSNAEIAARLHLSEHTVHRHIANIYRALGVGSRAAAASYAAGHGLI